MWLLKFCQVRDVTWKWMHAMGVLLYEILTGESPFASSKKKEENEWEEEITAMMLKGVIKNWHGGIFEDTNDLIM